MKSTVNTIDLDDFNEFVGKLTHELNTPLTILKANLEMMELTVEDIVSQIAQINQISSQNARSVEEIAGAADHLGTLTDNLNNKLEEFKT